MSRLVESIKILNGRTYNLKRHQARFDQSRMECFGSREKISLEKHIKDTGLPESGLFKCRILYEKKIQSIDFVPYQKPIIKKLRVVHSEPFDYIYKWESRNSLDTLFAQKEGADEIIIVINNKVTDGYYYNLVFEKNGIFHTPAHCLLKGTQRGRLLDAGRIVEREISIDDIWNYDHVHCINALNPLHTLSLSVSNILI